MSEQEELIFGKHAVLAFMQQPSDIHINKLLVMQGDRRDSLITRILELAAQQKIHVQTLSRKEFEHSVGCDKAHQGVAARLSPSRILQIQDFHSLLLARQKGAGQDESIMVTVLDGIEDPHNLGAIIRVAEASGAMAVFIPRHRSASVTGTVAKTSAGASAIIPIIQVTNLTQTIEVLKKEGFWIVGLDETSTMEYTQVDLKRRVAIVVGGEGKGISRLPAQHCDFRVSIPMLGRTESLNAAVAAGIMFYEVVRQNRVGTEAKDKGKISATEVQE